MLIIHNNPDFLPEPCVATIGFFDGVHLGHRYLIDQVKVEAKRQGLRSAVITFPVHPRQVMNAEYQPQLLTTFDEKISQLESTGVDYCYVLDFTRDISSLSAFRFMKEILKDRYNVSGLVIGHDHRFGHNRSEDFNDYCRFGDELHVNIVHARARIINNLAISSSVIRKLIETGDITQANNYLSYSYQLDGTVVDGYKVGRTIGYPTANINVNNPDKLIPAKGVYAVYVVVSGIQYKGMLNIGHRPTINNGSDLSIEVHILHFHSNIYNFPIHITFVERIRSEMKFSGKQELIAQLNKDSETADSLL